jgi:hypothetical protein
VNLIEGRITSCECWTRVKNERLTLDKWRRDADKYTWNSISCICCHVNDFHTTHTEEWERKWKTGHEIVILTHVQYSEWKWKHSYIISKLKFHKISSIFLYSSSIKKIFSFDQKFNKLYFVYLFLAAFISFTSSFTHNINYQSSTIVFTTSDVSRRLKVCFCLTVVSSEFFFLSYIVLSYILSHSLTLSHIHLIVSLCRVLSWYSTHFFKTFSETSSRLININSQSHFQTHFLQSEEWNCCHVFFLFSSSHLSFHL